MVSKIRASHVRFKLNSVLTESRRVDCYQALPILSAPPSIHVLVYQRPIIGSQHFFFYDRLVRKASNVGAWKFHKRMLERRTIGNNIRVREEPIRPWNLVVQVTCQTIEWSSDDLLSQTFSCLCCTQPEKQVYLLGKPAREQSSVHSSDTLYATKPGFGSARYIFAAFWTSSLFFMSDFVLRTSSAMTCKRYVIIMTTHSLFESQPVKMGCFGSSRQVFAVALVPINGSSNKSPAFVNFRMMKAMRQICFYSVRSIRLPPEASGADSMSLKVLAKGCLGISVKNFVIDGKRKAWEGSLPYWRLVACLPSALSIRQ